ncbi:MAG: alpha/beta hydrolase-fold protein [Myxococcota bacterium]
MSQTLEIRVHYPLADHQSLVLRTGQDWDGSVEPVSYDEARGSRFIVSLPDGLGHLYWKPCRIGAGSFSWSTGPNYYVPLPVAEPVEIWPYFGDGQGSLTERFSIADPTSGLEHEVRVYLPPGYEENHLKRYPTLYMHDGHNVFLAEEAYMNVEWRADETMNLLDAMSVTNKVIIVAVYPRDRMADYTNLGCGGYARYLAETLKPAIDQQFRTLPGPDHTAVMGSSLGGVVSMHLAWQWPEVFGAAACLSSTFGYADDLANRVRKEPLPNIRLYLDSGWPRDNFSVTREMATLLVERGMTMGEELMYFAFPLAHHSEKHWAARLHLPFQFLFGKVWSNRIP